MLIAVYCRVLVIVLAIIAFDYSIGNINKSINILTLFILIQFNSN